MKGFLNSNIKTECFACEACVQACPQNIISMQMDDEGFYYPELDVNKCNHCNYCHKVCPIEAGIEKFHDEQTVFGGYIKDSKIRGESTSGGAFSAIVENWCDENYVIFGAASDGLNVFHDYITDKKDLHLFRKSKYLQSKIGSAYEDAKNFLIQGKKVVFSGTPCQIAGLKTFLKLYDTTNLLTIEVICEGVPTPLFMKKYDEYLENKYGSKISYLDYRFTDMKSYNESGVGRWDFQVMLTILENKTQKKIDRWYNPFWNIWLNHLMSRPSCYKCPFTTKQRIADISLGDLWGVHIYCPELYGKNGGSSLIICNSNKGKNALDLSKNDLYGHILDIGEAIKYQSPMRKPIDYNENRDEFMIDVKYMDYEQICDKWYEKPSLKLLISKYIWGNRQKVWLWGILNKFK